MQINKIIFLLGGLFLSAMLTAQALEPLSLSDAIQIGLQRNYDIQIQEKTIDIAANNNKWGEAGLFWVGANRGGLLGMGRACGGH